MRVASRAVARIYVKCHSLCSPVRLGRERVGEKPSRARKLVGGGRKPSPLWPRKATNKAGGNAMKPLSPSDVLLLAEQGVLPSPIVLSWEAQFRSPTEDAEYAARMEEKGCLFLRVTVAVSVAMLLIATLIQAFTSGSTLLVAQVVAIVLVSVACFVALVGVIDYYAKRLYARYFQMVGGFGYELPALMEALGMKLAQAVGYEQKDFETAATIALNSKADELEAAEAAQRRDPTDPNNNEKVEALRKEFRKMFRLMGVFTFVDTELGWEPFFRRGAASKAA